MIYHNECKRCTNQWESCCYGHISKTEKEKTRHFRQMYSWICWDCFELLEAGEIRGLEYFNLFHYLNEKSDHYAGKIIGGYVFEDKYSTQCHPYIWDSYKKDGSIDVPGNYVDGRTAEQEQLRSIVSEIRELYLGIIKEQRTEKRIELDEYTWVMFGDYKRPKGFVGDPPGKKRFTPLFGLDPAKGDIIANEEFIIAAMKKEDEDGGL